MPDRPSFDHLTSCLDVTDLTIAEVLAAAKSWSAPTPRQKTLALLRRMAEVARPGRGAPKMLVVLAHMAHRDWLDGELRVRLIGDPEVSVLELLVDDGLSTARILGPLRIDVPFAEFRRALELHPDLVLPLEVDGALEARRVELVASERSRRNSLPPSLSAVSQSLIPALGGANRPLPEIVPVVAPPGPTVEDEAMLLDESLLESVPAPRFKPVTMPPHLAEALSSAKKKKQPE